MTYITAHGSAASLTHRVSPGIEPVSSWMLGRFISAESLWELLLMPSCRFFWEGNLFLIAVILMVVRWYLIVVLICMSIKLLMLNFFAYWSFVFFGGMSTQVLCPFFFFFLMEYSWLTKLCYFQVYSKGNQSYMYVYPFRCRFFTIWIITQYWSFSNRFFCCC